MLIEEITDIDTDEYIDLDEKRVWAKSGNKIVRKFRCMSGARKGRMVSCASQCSAPKNMKKSRTMKKTKAKHGFRMAKKANKTKRLNPVSKRIKRMNK